MTAIQHNTDITPKLFSGKDALRKTIWASLQYQPQSLLKTRILANYFTGLPSLSHCRGAVKGAFPTTANTYWKGARRLTFLSNTTNPGPPGTNRLMKLKEGLYKYDL